MEKFKFRNSSFRRIGDSYFNNFFTSDHFLGRDAFQENPLTKKHIEKDDTKKETVALQIKPIL